MNTIEQRPTPPNEWLYKEYNENYREFFKGITLPEGSGLLPECTDAEKRKWEEDHPEPQPEPEQ